MGVMGAVILIGFLAVAHLEYLDDVGMLELGLARRAMRTRRCLTDFDRTSKPRGAW